MKQTLSYLLLFGCLVVLARANAEAAAPTNEENAKPAVAASEPGVVYAARHLRAGTVLQQSDIIVGGDNSEALVQSIVGMETKRTIYANKIIAPEDLHRPTAIKRNSIITIEFKKGPLLITTEARALDAGAVGETVRVMNISSKVILSAVVVSSRKVRAR